MSHFTKLDKANIVDPDAFIKACKELGFDQVARDAKTKDYYNNEITADVVCAATKTILRQPTWSK